MHENAGQLDPGSGQFDVGLTFGVVPGRSLALQLETSWHGGQYDTLVSPGTLPNGGTYDRDMKFSAFEVALSARAYRHVHGMEPYVLGGLGIQSTRLSMDGRWTETVVIYPILAFDVVHDVTTSRSATGVAGHLGAGLHLISDEDPRYFAEIEVRHVWHTGDLAEMSGGGVDLGAWRYSVALGIRFDPSARPQPRRQWWE